VTADKLRGNSIAEMGNKASNLLEQGWNRARKSFQPYPKQEWERRGCQYGIAGRASRARRKTPGVGKELLEALVPRGWKADRRCLFVIARVKALRPGIKLVFGEWAEAQGQGCQIHKRSVYLRRNYFYATNNSSSPSICEVCADSTDAFALASNAELAKVHRRRPAAGNAFWKNSIFGAIG
jgi:hypothetical protein